MTISDVLASIALLVSLGTAAWTGYRALRWDRPVVSVSGMQWIGGSSHAPGAERAGFSLVVFNTGNQTTQIIDAAWQIDRGNGVDIRLKAVHGGGGPESLFQAPGDASTAPSLPFTLGRYDRSAWEFDMLLTWLAEPEGIIRARPMVEYTSRKKSQLAYGPWQPSQIRLHAEQQAKPEAVSDDSTSGAT